MFGSIGVGTPSVLPLLLPDDCAARAGAATGGWSGGARTAITIDGGANWCVGKGVTVCVGWWMLALPYDPLYSSSGSSSSSSPSLSSISSASSSSSSKATPALPATAHDAIAPTWAIHSGDVRISSVGGVGKRGGPPKAKPLPPRHALSARIPGLRDGVGSAAARAAKEPNGTCGRRAWRRTSVGSSERGLRVSWWPMSKVYTASRCARSKRTCSLGDHDGARRAMEVSGRA